MSTSAAVTIEQGLTRVAAIVGQEHASLRGETIVAAPRNTEQVAEVLRFAYANSLAVMPSGGSTKVGWGNPVSADIQLSMEGLSEVKEHAWQDMTCTVQAGCPWEVMQARLNQHGQMVALDPLWPERATVGGVVATNDSGALRLKYGGLRDLVIGMTIVLADGTIARTGGKVVKNVAGYDLHKLMTGSFGTLGVIAEVNFRLHPSEEHARTWTAAASGTVPSDVSLFTKPLRVLMDSQITPSCVQLRVSGQECGQECALDVRIAARPECLGEYADRIGRICDTLAVAESDHGVWQARQRLFEDRDSVVLKVSVLPGEICPFLSELRQWASEKVDMSAVACATGLMTVSMNPASEPVMTIIARLRARVGSAGGSVVALQVPDALRGRIDVWGPDPEALPLMREIKRQFDPGRILNPGRFVGSI
jgi:glycolate oxidase FAD binding subunit